MLRSYFAPQCVPSRISGRATQMAGDDACARFAALDQGGPLRLQLVRRTGFNLRAMSHSLNGRDVVWVARPGKWSNPFVVTTNFRPGTKIGINCVAVPTVQDAVSCFRAFLEENPSVQIKVREHLAGLNLACWCDPAAPCHADILLDIANR